MWLKKGRSGLLVSTRERKGGKGGNARRAFPLPVRGGPFGVARAHVAAAREKTHNLAQ